MDKPWLNNYPTGIPESLILQNKTLVDFIEEAFEKYKNLPMLRNMGKTLTYEEVRRLSENFSSYIQNFSGLKIGDHVAIQMPNILQFPVVVIGLLKAGMVLVNINPLYTPYEIKKQLENSKVKGIIVLENFAYKIEKIVCELNIETIVITKIGDLLGAVKGRVIDFVVKKIKKLVPFYKIKNVVFFKEVLKKGEKIPFRREILKNDDPAFIQYTGGTTGVAKGAVLSHKNVATNVEQMICWLNGKLKEGKETIITALPLYHIFSLTVNLFTMMKLGAANVLVTNPKNLKNFLNDFKKYKPTCFTGVNTLFNLLIQSSKFSKINFSSLKLTLSGGMSTSKKIAKDWESITGSPLVESYGLTEASPAVIGNPFDGTHKLGSVGLPIPNTKVMIVDKNFNKLPYNTPGELVVKGPQIMKEYWGNPEETSKVFKDGWLMTGDIASMDTDGFVTILERKKDMINISGFNVYPKEIEEIALMIPGVLEAAAIGFECEDCKEKIKLFIVKDKNEISEDEIIRHCKNFLTNYKIPQEVIFLSEMPKSQVGKILKKELKNLYQS